MFRPYVTVDPRGKMQERMRVHGITHCTRASPVAMACREMAWTPTWKKIATVKTEPSSKNVIYLRQQLALQIIYYFLQTGTLPHGRPSQSTRWHG